jgi:acyl-CoA synthetase (AMP-forming)/AMP-acid ligase II
VSTNTGTSQSVSTSASVNTSAIVSTSASGSTSATTNASSAHELRRGLAAEEHNIASQLVRSARNAPQRVAVHAPDRTSSRFGFRRRTSWSSLSFAELDERCDAIAHGLVARGLEPGDRVALFVRPGFDLVAITFALFKLGAVPLLIDPGMGAKAVVACLSRTKPRALVGVPAAHVLRALHQRELATITINVTVGPRWLAGATTLADLARRSHGVFAPRAVRADDAAAILFTSGSTGPAKGVVYSHANFAAQVCALRELYGLRAGEIDLACFPLFALFSAALEMTAVFPVIDPSRPARCDPALIVEAALEHGATSTFGSPAIWRRVVPHCLSHGIRLPSLARVLIAGASVPLDLVEDFHRVLADGADVHTPYGATECLPVSTISGRELLGDRRARSESGAGTCVGNAAPGVEIALVEISDEPIGDWRDARIVPRMELGEICVRGDVVTREYAGDERATSLAKIRDGDSIWHRMGDVAYLDDEGLLWFCGRKSQRIETRDGLVMPVPSENIFNLHPRVRQCALVGVGPRGSERPGLVIEPRVGEMPKRAKDRETLSHELREFASARARAIGTLVQPRIDTVLYRRALPVDVRHNAKIQREKLKAWAEGRAR